MRARQLAPTTVFGRLNKCGPALGRRNWRMLATDTENSEEQSMDFRKCEAVIQQMIEGSNLETKEPGKNRVLTEWRATLSPRRASLEQRLFADVSGGLPAIDGLDRLDVVNTRRPNKCCVPFSPPNASSPPMRRTP
jgi:hypothetical protein